MKNQNAFKRAKEMMSKIQYIMTQTKSPILADLLIGQLGAYKSRGHGGGHTPHAKFGFAFAQMRSASRNVTPHQGAREIARRLARNDWGFHSHAAR
jgi:hypothetical protein